MNSEKYLKTKLGIYEISAEERNDVRITSRIPQYFGIGDLFLRSSIILKKQKPENKV